MKRGDKIIVFVDMLGFARLTEDYPRQIYRYRKGHIRGSGTSESQNQLGTFHSVLDQTTQYFSRYVSGISAMSFSDCGFVKVGNPFLSATFASALMQHFVRAGVPVRMGMAAGTFWPVRMSSDVYGSSTVSRAIFYGSAIVRAHQAESCGLSGMRIFLHESLETEFGSITSRFPVLRLKRKAKKAVAELSYLYQEEAYFDVNHPDPLEDDLMLWKMASLMRLSLPRNVRPRVRLQYSETLSALNRMRLASARPRFKRSEAPFKPFKPPSD
jgi:hypothetical protein